MAALVGKIRSVRDALNKVVVGHSDMIDAVLAGVLAKQHVVIIGPPGIAKSMTVRLLARMLRVPSYTYLMTRYTTFHELFGPIDVQALVRDGVVRRRWSRIVDARLVFLDEVFKASSAVLNALLSFMEERVVYDPYSGEAVKTKLWTLVGASNEVPRRSELAAVYDRFAVKHYEGYAEQSALLEAYRRVWSGFELGVEPLSEEELTRLHAVVRDKVLELRSFYEKVLIPALLKARSVTRVSDRTIISKAPLIHAALTILRGDPVDAAVDTILYLSADREERDKLMEIAEDVTGAGVLMDVEDAIREAKELVARGKVSEAIALLESVLSHSFDVPDVAKRRLERLLGEARSLLNKLKSYESSGVA